MVLPVEQKSSGSARRSLSAVTGPLRAATAPDARGGEYFGPKRLHMIGPPVVETPPRRARDEAVARELWERSLALTGASFAPVPVAAA